jgi:hypothetical protein
MRPDCSDPGASVQMQERSQGAMQQLVDQEVAAHAHRLACHIEAHSSQLARIEAAILPALTAVPHRYLPERDGDAPTAGGDDRLAVCWRKQRRLSRWGIVWQITGADGLEEALRRQQGFRVVGIPAGEWTQAGAGGTPRNPLRATRLVDCQTAALRDMYLAGGNNAKHRTMAPTAAPAGAAAALSKRGVHAASSCCMRWRGEQPRSSLPGGMRPMLRSRRVSLPTMQRCRGYSAATLPR